MDARLKRGVCQQQYIGQSSVITLPLHPIAIGIQHMYGIKNRNSVGLYFVACLVSALVLCTIVEIVCVMFGVAPLFTPNLAFNEKLRFIREHRPGSAPVGVVTGASIALNDVDTDLLAQREGQPFINLGVNALPVDSAERFYDEFGGVFPVREVIFAALPTEMRDGFRANVEVKDDLFRRYVSGKMTMPEEFSYRDIAGMLSYWQNWKDYHSRSAHTSLVFSETGAVPLEIDRDHAEPRLWDGAAIVPELGCSHCTDGLVGFCREVRGQGRQFTVVLGPVRPQVLERRPDVLAVDKDRRARVRWAVQECGGTLFDADQFATFDDSCFADSAHLNARGMHEFTGLLVRFRRGEALQPGSAVSCPTDAIASR
jgi:hypothetical protein